MENDARNKINTRCDWSILDRNNMRHSILVSLVASIALSGLMNVTPVDLVTINLLYVSSILTLSMNLSEIVRCADKRITAAESLILVTATHLGPTI